MLTDPKSFDSLQKLLRLKRWEAPSEEHLDRLSSRIIAQIKVERVNSNTTWWSRVASFLDFKPVFACAYSATAMSLLVIGLGMNEKKADLMQTFQPPSSDGLSLATCPTDGDVCSASFSLPQSEEIMETRLESFSTDSMTPRMQPVVRSSLPASAFTPSLRAQFLENRRIQPFIQPASCHN
ncbi:MAG: hypothetical protein M2R45_05301 [Verrucomicrobia subdivision 3 bacterium]|nr:hypothetical protein [Limisphaerales bacterium]MCS1417820.1 hypothetical protein [Limisphaerales bacterium]